MENKLKQELEREMKRLKLTSHEKNVYLEGVKKGLEVTARISGIAY